jgi:NAD+ kinase
MLGNLLDRHMAHEDSIQLCKDVLKQRTNVQWCMLREELNRPINDVDLVVTIGGDGTLLQASHHLGDSIPVLGVNSDPTIFHEVEEKLAQYDASRSTGQLCATTAETFKQVLDEILEGQREPTRLTRIRTRVDGTEIGTCALNDVLVAHPNPAAVSRCTFSISSADESKDFTPTVHSRSSGIRICTAAGSTAAMRSAGGYPMAQESSDLQYMVREPIMPHSQFKIYMHGWVQPGEMMNLKWGCRRGMLYFDGSHVVHEIKFGSVIQFSCNAPALKIFLSSTP